MESVKNHFRGELTDIVWKEPDPFAPTGPATNLKEMARRAMNYFLRTPRPELNYACRFSNALESCPPGPQGEDLVANGDTDVRMDSCLPGLRELSGLSESTDVDEGLHKRVLGYLGEDNLSHAPYAMCCASDMPPETIVTSLWTSGWTIRSITERWLRNRESALKEKARRIALALKKVASWDTGRAFFPGGLILDGRWIGGFFGGEANFYTLQICDLMHYAEATGDEEIADFAYALARGVVAGLPEGIGMRCFREDGSFTDHTHIHTRVLWGVAMAGRVMRDPALIEWARRGYEFVRSCGTDFGWFPERIILPGEHPFDGYEERVNVSETCCMGDMTQTALQLARCGYPHYWDHVERYVCNYLKEVQFAVTPEVEEFYRKVNSSLPSKEVERGLEILRDFEGGFISNVRPNQWGGCGFRHLPMAGCCPPEGARALVAAWNGTVMKEGDAIRVNMSFDYEGPLCVLKMGSGRLEVTAKERGTYLLRPPSWAERKSIGALRDGKKVPAEWYGDYVRFLEVKSGEVLSLTWKVPHFCQVVQVGGRIASKCAYTILWEGNRVRGIRPAGRIFPMFRRGPSGGSLAGLLGTDESS